MSLPYSNTTVHVRYSVSTRVQCGTGSSNYWRDGGFYHPSVPLFRRTFDFTCLVLRATTFEHPPFTYVDEDGQGNKVYSGIEVR